MDAPAINLAPFLQQIFKAHGIDGSIDGEWVVLPRPYARASAVIVDETRHGKSLVVVQLDVRVVIAFGRMIVESFTGFGHDRAEAVRDALNAFVDGAFHVILAACFDVETDQLERERWTIGGVERMVTIGPAQCRGMGERPLQFDVKWFDQLRAAIVRHGMLTGQHWVRLYTSHSDRKLTTCEVLLDNDAWQPVQDDAARIDWPQIDGFASHRIFLIAQGGIDVAELAGVLHAMRERDGDAIEMEFVRRGLSPREAQVAVVMIPLAFGRVALKTRVGQFADHLVLATASGRPIERIGLADHPIFQQASKLAQDAVDHGTLTKDQFSDLALRGAEMQAVNNALHAGEKPGDLVLSPTILLLRDDETGRFDHGEPPTPPAPSTALPARDAAAPSRRWWRFWS